MDEQLERIKAKLEQLRSSDPNNGLFGASTHKYRLNPTIPIDKIRKFELAHNVDLPSDYAAFLMNIGNGGAGPFYGLERLEDALFDDLDYKRPDALLNPAKPFLHTEAWNQTFKPTVNYEEDEEEYEKQRIEFEERYFDRQQMNGVIAICNFGCGVRLSLVVNGQEYGNIWTDDRSSDYGIHPSYELGNKDKISFLNWYELWLDKSLKERAGKSQKIRG
ncbi:SMI1 / KNR4 family (SUKH-1) [Chitinophaga ginsengisegetis]|uniref:SMI1 / KNR4 family (SUKH-1) n=1 Tax=Chitinophaga ginsengisegetis TaxID=393003 RepID=A0A1T5N5F2_9BACT|nr:SMI1/KNR4 family protein [Chitinophaga ginsengisegetis]SKC95574.1 SMI1 / KNR4 family (SUKH-1) [Chitinophaga ginsengisegetis]